MPKRPGVPLTISKARRKRQRLSTEPYTVTLCTRPDPRPIATQENGRELEATQTLQLTIHDDFKSLALAGRNRPARSAGAANGRTAAVTVGLDDEDRGQRPLIVFHVFHKDGGDFWPAKVTTWRKQQRRHDHSSRPNRGSGSALTGAAAAPIEETQPDWEWYLRHRSSADADSDPDPDEDRTANRRGEYVDGADVDSQIEAGMLVTYEGDKGHGDGDVIAARQRNATGTHVDVPGTQKRVPRVYDNSDNADSDDDDDISGPSIDGAIVGPEQQSLDNRTHEAMIIYYILVVSLVIYGWYIIITELLL
ncbi:hypothetical protein HD806DRAFT_540733 [Xylariaceae sp. AK1471]|nr:hypothetical protein HD806DRAFT_540733 [Xylariaceae sp. AK1471]